MKKRGFDLKRMAWITRGRISTLTMEQFCEILDRLPLDFEFKLSNISEETDGHWIKERFRENKSESEKSHFIWHNLTNDRYCSSVSFFPIKNRIIDAIHRKGAFFTYFKIKKDWHTLHQVFMGYRTSNKLIKEKLKKLYYEQSKSLEDIAKKYGCSRMYISKIMKKYGLERRTKSEARIEAIKKGKFERFEYDDINENFFIGWSPGMAWILGLLFTDGNIQPNKVSLCSVDIELLEKVKKLLNSTRPIYKQIQSYDKSKYIFRYEFYHENMRRQLNELGLIPRKSLKMIFPDVPEKYLRHFIRGCWDGDGSVFISGGKMNANYTCGSLNFVQRLVQELYKIGIHKRRLPLEKTDADRMWSNYPIGKYPLAIHKEKRSKSYYIKIDSKDNLEKLFHYFYDNVDESIYLNRKFKTFVKGLKLPEGAETEQLNLDLSF